VALDFLRQGDCSFYGPALPEPYVRFELEKALGKHELLPDTDGLAGETLRDQWDIFRRKLRDVSPNSGPVAITNRIIEPLVSRLGYAGLAPADEVLTREGNEAGGLLMADDAGAKLRCWAIEYDADLDSPTQRGYAYRFSPIRIAQRVLLATGERIGLVTNGVELRLLLCDPARPDSHIEIDLNVWRLSRDLPDGYLLLLALASPKGVAALPEIVEDARLKQNKVTKELRVQARLAVEEFVQAVLDHPDNAAALAGHADTSALAKALWHEGLIVVYRLLFILKCESTSDSSRVFRFASTPLWRNTYSPSTALARMVRRVLDEGAASGRYLEDGLRVLFKLFADGLDHPGLTVRPLGGALFGAQSTPLLSSLRWGDLAVAHLLNRLLWSDTRRGRERVHYGPLDVEDLGRVYEALLELEPGIAAEPMCRLRRQKLEVVVPAAQGDKYKTAGTAVSTTPSADADDGVNEDDDGEEDAEEEKPTRGKKTKVEWIEAINTGRFYLRVGLGRKSSGSYYTPHSFVRFLVQETLGPQCDERSPREDPDAGAILKLKVLDPACGSGHFLVEACRFLAARVYEAARLCDELASKAEHDAEAEKNVARKQALLDRAAELRQRLKDLPDQEDELLSYLPSRSAGADKAVLSAHDIARAEAICRRLVAVHCIYGADLNPLAVELAKLSLWIESHAEGYPLTFLDHRIVVGNSLTGPFWDKLTFAPGSQEPIEGLWRQGLYANLTTKLGEALSLVRRLEESVGVDVQDIAAKQQLKRELDARLNPFRILAAAWSGGVMLGTEQPDGAPRCDDDAYADLLKQVGTSGELPANVDDPNLRAMITTGLGISIFDPSSLRGSVALSLPALSYDLTFPEVFHPTAQPNGQHGFDAVIGNPPWNKIRLELREILSALDPELLVGKEAGRSAIDVAVLEEAEARHPELVRLRQDLEASKRATRVAVPDEVNPFALVGGDPDMYQMFAARATQFAARTGRVGFVLAAGLAKTPADLGIRKALSVLGYWQTMRHFVNMKRLFTDLPQVIEFIAYIWSATTPDAATLVFDAIDVQGLEHDIGETWNADQLRKTVATTGSFPRGPESDGQREPVGTFVDWLNQLGIGLSNDLHRTADEAALTPLSNVMQNASDARDPSTIAELLPVGFVPAYSGRSIAAHNNRPMLRSGKWRPEVDYVARLDHPSVCSVSQCIRFYRLCIRSTCGSPRTNQRSAMACVLPPGTLATNSLWTERNAADRPNSNSLIACGVINAFPVDFEARKHVISNFNQGIMREIPSPRIADKLTVLLVHGALRLGVNDELFAFLWHEQLGDAWREPGKAPFTWPVLAGDDERWAVRAAIDAVVADAYRLSREQYAHVLSTFSHTSYKKAPDLCLTAFDELKSVGLDDFCKKHDPYHDIPLVETLPKPVIDLPIPDDPAGGENANSGGGARGHKRGRRSKRNNDPVLWQEKSGQLTLESPGPVFDQASARNPAPAALDPGKVLAVQTLLEMREVLTSAEIQKEFDLDAAHARAILKHLSEKKLASVEGKAKGTRYRWLGQEKQRNQ
jgi:hypothetical protein